MNPRVVVDYVANTKQLQAASGQLGESGGKMGAALHKAMLPAVATLGAVAAGAGKAVKAASDLNEQISASQQVFGKHAKGVQAWAKTGAQSFGLSQREALQAANAYGNMFSTIGLGDKDVTNMSKSMTQLAGDMASFHDQDPSDMLDRLRSGLAGEAEPLRRFGVLLSEAAVQQEAVHMGLSTTGKNLTEAQKVQARYSLIMKQTSKAQGDFARTGDSVANQQRTLTAENENLAASFGQALLPVTQTFMKMMQAVLGVIGANKTVLTVLVATIAALAAAIILANGAVAVWNAAQIVAKGATMAWTAVQWLLNAAMLANPFALVVVAVAALVAAFIVAYKTSDTFRKIVDTAFDAVLKAAQAVFNWLKGNWPLIVGILTGPFGTAIVLIVKHWDAITDAVQSAVSAIRSLLNGLVGWLTGTLKGALSTATRAVGAVFDFLADGARDAYESVQRNLNGMVNFIKGIVGSVRSAAESVANAVKGPINAVIGAWNALAFPRVAFHIPAIKIAGKKVFGGKSIGFGPFPFPNIPTLAQGGVIEGPTLALVGEGTGREIVTPENLLREIVNEGGGPEVHVYIGETELRGMVRTEVVDVNTGIARTLLAGSR